MSADWEIQVALNSALTALGLTVYDVAPQATDGGSTSDWPFVTIGAVVLAPWDTKGKNGFDFVARIHTRSRSASMKEAKNIHGQIYDRLHNGTLSISGYDLTLLQFAGTSDVTQVADKSFHGFAEYRGLIEKA